MARSTDVFLHAIATGTPEHSYTQSFALEFLLALQGDSPKKRTFLERVYANTGIEKRHTVIDDYGKAPSDYTFYPKTPDMTPEPETWQRNDVFIRESNRLALSTAERLFEGQPSFERRLVTHLITVSCTGFSVPGFDLHLVKHLGLEKGVHRFHIGFMGCYAAFPAMKLARDICLAHPEARVLIVALELCTLHFQQTFNPETVVANAIFADGAAAALVSAQREDSPGPAFRMDGFSSYLIDDSEAEMAWRIGKHGFDMRLSMYVPRLIEANIREVVETLLTDTGVALGDIDRFAIHPGGRAILDKVAAELHLDPDALEVSYGVLRDFGNMSSATILFVLERILKAPDTGRVLAAAFGPGLTVESGILYKDEGRSP
jgi:predicted naringenin-chalcone synthase